MTMPVFPFAATVLLFTLFLPDQPLIATVGTSATWIAMGLWFTRRR